MSKKQNILTPDRLDQLHSVIDPKGWLGLFILLSVIAIASIWLFVGKIPTSVSGTGILINTQGLRTVVVNASGRLTIFDVQVGQKIKKGQVIGEVSQTELLNQIESVEKEINEKNLSNKEKESLRHLLESKYEERIDSLKTRLLAQQRLLKSGVVIEENVLKTKDEIIQAENEYENIKIKRLDDEHDFNELVRKLENLKSEYQENSIIHSPYSGTVVEVKETVGSVVQPGKALLTLELTGMQNQSDLEAVIYISALEGKKISAGMEIKIVPSIIKPQEYGSLIGEVVSVSNYPATYDSMMRVFQNDLLVKDMIKSGAQVEIVARLIEDENTVSGFKWTSKKGPPIKMQSGMLSTAKIQTRERTPFELIIPEFKRILGVEQ